MSRTRSGIEIARVYGPGDVKQAPTSARRVPVHARHLPEHVPRQALDDAAVRRLRHARGDEPALQVPARAGPDRAVGRARPADAARLRLRRTRGGGRGRARWAWRSIARRHGDDLRGHPARQGLHLHSPSTPPRRSCSRCTRRRRAEAGRARASAISGTMQNDLLKEFGARGAWIFPIEPSMRLVRATRSSTAVERAAALQPDLDRLALPRRGRHSRRGGGLHALPTGVAYVKACLARGLPIDALRAAAVVLLLHLRQLLRGGGQVPRRRGASGRGCIQERFGAEEPGVAAAARRLRLRRPLAHHAPSRSTTSPRTTHRDHGGGLRRPAVGVHRRLRRGVRAFPTELSARTALRVQQIVAYETDVAKTIDPLGRQLLRRGAHRRHGAGDHARCMDEIDARGRHGRGCSTRATCSGASPSAPSSTSATLDDGRGAGGGREQVPHRRGGARRAGRWRSPRPRRKRRATRPSGWRG